MHIDNRHFYGYLPVPLGPDQTLSEEVDSFTHLLMEIMSKNVLLNSPCNIHRCNG